LGDWRNPRFFSGKERPMARYYILEFNRAYGDNIRTAARRLQRRGLDVEILFHKTSLVAIRPSWMSWAEFQEAIRAALDPTRGSVLVVSQSTGRAFICSNRGNQPGIFQQVGMAA
jgi:hypothetical protein